MLLYIFEFLGKYVVVFVLGVSICLLLGNLIILFLKLFGLFLCFLFLIVVNVFCVILLFLINFVVVCVCLVLVCNFGILFIFNLLLI